MLYMIPIRFTKSKGARFKAVVDFTTGFQFRLVDARSNAECARKLQAGLRHNDNRDIGRKSYIGCWTLDKAKDAMYNSWRTADKWEPMTDERKAQFADSWENLVRTVRDRGVL